ncbi:MAG: acetyl-CoA hydrolase/transferase C-terminal domain-containing protein [Oscillospiraceae bacterium]|nr:acetyl-CoA hydrolase/transferase C-terminal domain-containing protein [Oscillospiraceae bacterium]
MTEFEQEYQRKLKTADEAVKVVKDGDWISYGEFVTITPTLDRALAKRKNELHDIHIEACTLRFDTEIRKADPDGEVFDINDRSLSPYSRRQGSYYMVGSYEENIKAMTMGHHRNVAFISVCPMDEHGYFNLSTTCSNSQALIDNCDHIIVEVNNNIPYCYGGSTASFHISQVESVVMSDNQPLESLPKVPSNDADIKIAHLLMNELEDGCCLQLGIGGIPNKVGEFIVDSDVKDLGVHTEMMMDAFMKLYQAGKVTNKCKAINKGQMVYTFAMGSSELYDFLNRNETALKLPSNYTNDPYTIGKNPKVFAVNNCLHVDLFSQVSSESVGNKQISGVGGQWDFIYGAFLSEGGKGFVCMNSTATRKDKEGKAHLESRIVSQFVPGTCVSVPRHHTFYVVTEYGCKNLKGLSTWERAEAVVSLAHPDFRDGLIKDAEKAGLWRKSNKHDHY